MSEKPAALSEDGRQGLGPLASLKDVSIITAMNVLHNQKVRTEQKVAEAPPSGISAKLSRLEFRQ